MMQGSECTLGSGAGEANPAAEAAIRAMVLRFYELCFADGLLGPMFRAVIDDFPAHYEIVQDFWSHALLGTDRYKRGTPFVHHLKLEVSEAHFTRWLAAFRQAVAETLPPPLAEPALRRAAHMTESFRMGMLPLPRPAAPA